MARNLDLLERTLTYTVEHQEAWDQGWWAVPLRDDGGNICGTACCFAGNVLLVEGYRYEWNAGDELAILDPAGMHGDYLVAAMASARIEGLAQRLLGLTDTERWLLFCATNTLERLRAIIDGWKAEAAEEGS